MTGKGREISAAFAGAVLYAVPAICCIFQMAIRRESDGERVIFSTYFCGSSKAASIPWQGFFLNIMSDLGLSTYPTLTENR